MIIAPKEKCYGCEACANTCSKQAIKMITDDKGFKYPLIEEDKCISCGMCRKVCPSIIDTSSNASTEEQKCFGAQNNNEHELARSSSGGVFIALARTVISQGGVVFGCRFDNDHNPIYDIAESFEQLLPMQGSKYVEAEIGVSFIRARKELNTGRLVLFTGSPCKLDGLRRFLGKDYKNLICCEIVCHGVPSRLFFNDYIQYEEGRIGRKIDDISFRDKSRGWGYLIKLAYHDDSDKSLCKFFRSEESYFLYYFCNNYFYRESCYSCEYAKTSRCSDITIGDFWGVRHYSPEKSSNNGYSIIITSTEKGYSLLKSSEKRLDLFDVSINEITHYNPNLVEHTRKPNNNDYEWSIYKKNGIDCFARRYVKNHKKEVVLGKVKRVIPLKAFYAIKEIKRCFWRDH